MATAATMLPHISWGPLQPLLDLTPACPQHTSAQSRPLLLLFLASLSYFSCVFFCCCTFCVCFFFLFFSSTPPNAFSLKYLSVIEVHWTESLRGTGGFSASLALEQSLFSPVTSRGPRCVTRESSCEPRCLGQLTGCCGPEESAGVPPLFLTTRCSSGAGSNKGGSPLAAEQEVNYHKGECHSM